MIPAGLFSPAALREIDRRWKRLSVDSSARVADQFLYAVRETATMLQQFPFAGTVCSGSSPRLMKLRQFPVKSPFERWTVLYTVRADRVVVLRVLHGSQQRT